MRARLTVGNLDADVACVPRSPSWSLLHGRHGYGNIDPSRSRGAGETGSAVLKYWTSRRAARGQRTGGTGRRCGLDTAQRKAIHGQAQGEALEASHVLRGVQGRGPAFQMDGCTPVHFRVRDRARFWLCQRGKRGSAVRRDLLGVLISERYRTDFIGRSSSRNAARMPTRRCGCTLTARRFQPRPHVPAASLSGVRRSKFSTT